MFMRALQWCGYNWNRGWLWICLFFLAAT